MAALSPEIVALVHHIELHDSDWWNEAVSRIALACLLNARNPLESSAVHAAMQSSYGVNSSLDDVTEALKQIELAGRAIRSSGQKYTPSHESLAEAQASSARAAELESKVSRLFGDRMCATCPDIVPPPSWQDFRDNCLLPLLAQEGAQAAALSLGCDNGNGSPGEAVADWVTKYDPDGAEGLAPCILAFLSEADIDVREYVLERLDAQFVVAAAGLDTDTIRALTSSKPKKLTLRLVLDTNFLFSVMGWHDHPSNDVANAVLEIARTTDGEVDVELLVLPTTVEEAKNAVTLKAEKLDGIRWTKGLADAAVEFGAPGLVEQYIQSQTKNDFSLALTEYADLIAHDLEARLQDLGVNAVYEDVAAYSMNPEVLDNINDQITHEKTTRNEVDRRDYQLVKHDMIAYQWTLDQRPAGMKTAVDAGYWLVTLDKRLLGFDRYKCRGNTRGQVCLHPATAVQFLQFWIPRSEAIRSAIFSSVKQPLLPASSLAETERITYRIIERLGTLAGIEDVSSEAIRDALADTALRRVMKSASGADEELALIEEAFVRIASEKERELSEARAHSAQLERELDASKKTIAKQAEIEEGRRTQVEKLKGRVLEAATQADSLGAIVEEQGKVIEGLDERLATAEKESTRARWVLRWIVLPAVVLTAVGLVCGTALVAWMAPPRNLIAAGLLVLLLILVFMWIVAKSHDRVPIAAESPFASRLARAHRYVWGVAFASILFGFIGSMLWDTFSK